MFICGILFVTCCLKIAFRTEQIKRQTANDSEKQRYEKGWFGKNDSNLLRPRLAQRYKKRG